MSIEHDRRVVIYPDYIDARNTVKRGRKVPVPPGARRARGGRGMTGTALPSPSAEKSSSLARRV